MQNVLADLCVESEAATVAGAPARARLRRGRPRLPPARDRGRQVLGLQGARRRIVAEALECLGGNGYVEESGLPRLYRESPLNSIWEGAGNVNCLDVLRALQRSQPESLDAFLAEVAAGRGSDRAPRRAPLARSARRARRHGRRRAARPPARRAARALPAGLAARPPRRRTRSPTRSARRGSAARAAAPTARCRAASTGAAIVERHRPLASAGAAAPPAAAAPGMPTRSRRAGTA